MFVQQSGEQENIDTTARGTRLLCFYQSFCNLCPFLTYQAFPATFVHANHLFQNITQPKQTSQQPPEITKKKKT